MYLVINPDMFCSSMAPSCFSAAVDGKRSLAFSSHAIHVLYYYLFMPCFGSVYTFFYVDPAFAPCNADPDSDLDIDI